MIDNSTLANSIGLHLSLNLRAASYKSPGEKSRSAQAKLGSSFQRKLPVYTDFHGDVQYHHRSHTYAFVAVNKVVAITHWISKCIVSLVNKYRVIFIHVESSNKFSPLHIQYHAVGTPMEVLVPRGQFLASGCIYSAPQRKLIRIHHPGTEVERAPSNFATRDRIPLWQGDVYLLSFYFILLKPTTMKLFISTAPRSMHTAPRSIHTAPRSIHTAPRSIYTRFNVRQIHNI